MQSCQIIKVIQHNNKNNNNNNDDNGNTEKLQEP